MATSISFCLLSLLLGTKTLNKKKKEASHRLIHTFMCGKVKGKRKSAKGITLDYAQTTSKQTRKRERVGSPACLLSLFFLLPLMLAGWERKEKRV